MDAYEGTAGRDARRNRTQSNRRCTMSALLFFFACLMRHLYLPAEFNRYDSLARSAVIAERASRSRVSMSSPGECE